MADGNGKRQHYLQWADRGKPALWRYATAVALTFVVWMFGEIPVALLFPDSFADPAHRSLLLPWGFLPGLIAVLLFVRLFLGRPGYSLFAQSLSPRWSDYLVGVALGTAIGTLLSVSGMLFSPIEYQGFSRMAELGLLLMIVMIVGFVVQTAFEELFFRGLIMQLTWQIKAWLPLALLVQATMFAIPHFGNFESMRGIGLISVLPYGIIAAAWGWVGWRTGSLLMPMGLHFANNSLGVLLFGTKGDLLVSYAPILAETPSFLFALIGVTAQAALTVVAVEFWMRRRERQAVVETTA